MAAASFQMDRQQSAGMIIRETSPENLEFPFSSLAGTCTPTDQFYIRSHFATPQIDEGTYRLRIKGQVEIELTLADLYGLPQTEKTVTMECAGNNRIFLTPQVKGAQWQLGAVSTAEWSGVLLSSILDRAGVQNGSEVILQGADQGKAKEPPAPPGEIHYARSLPLAKARQNVLLALSMNGQPLSASHGFPLRAVVPGWFGMASVKWLTQITVTDRPFHGYFQTTDYAYWKQIDGQAVRVPITEMQIKAQMARPAPHEVVPRSTEYTIFGAAWGGASPVVKVEISADGGKHYTPAKLLDHPIEDTWRLWEYAWQTPAQPGPVTLMARATNAAGQTQPAERDWNWGTYVVCHTIPIPVIVR